MPSIPRPSHTATSLPDRFFASLNHLEHIAPGESADESMLHYTVVYPILEAIIKAVEEKLGDAGVVCSYNMDDACPTASKSRKPVTMLYGEGYHFASIAVREDEDKEQEAFDDAIAAAMLLTPKTGYSVIVVGVAYTEVTMGLLSLLHRSKSGVHPRLEMAVFPTELNRLLSAAGVDRVDVHTSDGVNKKYGIRFSADEVKIGFTDAFQKYLSLLVEPICSGLSGGIVSKQLPDTAQGCPVVMNSNVPDDLQLPAMCAGGVYKIFTAQEYYRVGSLNCADRPPFCASLPFERYPDEPKCKKSRSDDSDCSDSDCSNSDGSESGDEKRKSAALWKAVFSDLDDPWLRAKLKVATKAADPKPPEAAAEITNAQRDGSDSNTTKGIAESEDSEMDETPIESDSLTICCIYRHMDGGSELTERPSTIVAAKLLAMIVVLHDVYEIVHCDVRRSNVVVSGCAVELVGYEHGAMWLDEDDVLPRGSSPCMMALKKLMSTFSKDVQKCLLHMEYYLGIRVLDILSFFLCVWLSDSSIETESAEDAEYRKSVLEAIVSGGMKAVENRSVLFDFLTSDVLSHILQQTPCLKEVWEVIDNNALFKKKSIADVNATTCEVIGGTGC